MITLCEKCFPEWGHYEVYSTTPLGPCAVCGVYDNKYSSPNGIRCNLFPRDPREVKELKARDNL